jgi:protein-disulfide isomerase
MSKLAVPVSPEDHRQGDMDAAFTLVEYGDYECPSCGQAYPIVKRLQKHFGKRLLFVFRNFPLSQMHPHAESAPRQRNSRELTTSFGRCTICFSRTRTASETGFWRS